MKQFLKPTFINLDNDEYYKDVTKVLTIPNIKINTVGTYAKFGKDKACDLDMNQDISRIKLEQFQDFIKELKKKKKQYHLITSYFDIPHKLIKEIYDSLGYLNGVLDIINVGIKEVILPIISKLPDDISKEVKELYEDYLSKKTLTSYLRLKTFLKKNIYSQWSLQEIIDGKKNYYGQELDLSKDSYSYYYIEIIYKKFRSSNLIFFKSETKREQSIINTAYILEELYVNNEEVDYYVLVKSFLFFIKFLYYNRILKDYKLINNSQRLYEEVYSFRKQLSDSHNKFCNIKNKVDIAKNKLIKYKVKDNKEKITKYNNIIDKYDKLLEQDQIATNKICKDKYIKITSGYEDYLRNNMIIV